MKFYNTEFRHNKRMSENSGKRKKLTTKVATLALISFLVISASFTLFSTAVFAEPDLSTALNELGFTNIVLSDVETFPAGIYEVKLLAEFGNFRDINLLSYYPVGTENYQTIFTGPEGVTVGGDGDYVIPPLSKIIVVEQEFGLSLFAPYRYFTETWKNPDYPEQHAQIYANLGSPNMFVVCFEDSYGGIFRDFNDMILSIEQIFPPKIVNVIKSPAVPLADEPVTITAQVTEGNDPINSVVLSYKVGSSGWFELPMTLEGSGYVAEIPGKPATTEVNYKVSAFDTKGRYDVSSQYTYTTKPIFSGLLPIAQIVYSPSGAYTGEVIDFDGSTSYDVDGTIVSYLWDFGDGNNATGVTVSHSYEEDGEYLVILRVVDNEDLVGTYLVTLVVKNRRPVADFTVSASTVYQNEIVSFDASASYDLDGTIVSYTWSFGDGAAATGVTDTHSYSDTGFYTVTVTVNDNDGATDDRKSSILVIAVQDEPPVANKPPVASFESTAETVTIDETVSFDASESYDTDGTIETYSWDFGDGTTAIGVTVDHAYDDGGIYTVTLIVTDDDGATDYKISSVTVTEIVDDEPEPVMNDPPVALFTKSVETASIGENISFDASESYDTDGTIETYSWDFGDGTMITGVTADHTYTKTGNYEITLTVTDNDGAESSVIAEMTVNTETTVSLAVLSAIGLGITGLTAALLIIFFQRRKKRKKS